VSLRVRVSPRASRDALAGTRGGALLVRLTAPPVEGQANAALARLLARALGLAPSAVELLRGASGRDKLVRLHGLDLESARSRLLAQLADSGP
jgi:uncharacterized protein (TIGR00251 family)